MKALGGGIAVQHRMAYQGEDFAKRYGKEMTAEAPPIRRILAAGVPLGAGTDATRVASYNPWVSLYWLVTGKRSAARPCIRERTGSTVPLRCGCGPRPTRGSRTKKRKKGAIKAGQLADLAVLSADYMNVAEDEIKNLVSVLTVLDGTVVHGDRPFNNLAPPLPPASPDWSPVNRFGGYYKHGSNAGVANPIEHAHAHAGCSVHCQQPQLAWLPEIPAANQREFWGALGCNCWFG